MVVQLSMKQVILCRVAIFPKNRVNLEVGSWSSIVSDEVPLNKRYVVLGYMGLFEAHDGSSISVRIVNHLLKNWLRREIHIFLCTLPH